MGCLGLPGGAAEEDGRAAGVDGLVAGGVVVQLVLEGRRRAVDLAAHLRVVSLDVHLSSITYEMIKHAIVKLKWVLTVVDIVKLLNVIVLTDPGQKSVSTPPLQTKEMPPPERCSNVWPAHAANGLSCIRMSHLYGRRLLYSSRDSNSSTYFLRHACT